MFTTIKNFFYRHRRKFIIGGVVIGGVIFGSRYAQRRFIEWQEKETKEFLERTRKQQYFESTEKTCNQTIIFLSSTLRENINKQLNCEAIIKKLKEGATNKVELWNELKVLVFIKVSLLIYAGTLLVIALRIQLNIIGGHIYCKTLVPEVDSKINNNLQEKYLSRCHYFLEKGIIDLCSLIKEKVNLVLKDVTLKQNMTLQNVENIFWTIQSLISCDSRNPLKLLPQLIYGPEFSEEDVLIKDMMMDTIDLLQNAEVSDIASSCINQGFSNVIDKISEFFLPDDIVSHPSTSHDNFVRISQPNKVAKPCAKIIPIINLYGNPSDSTESWVFPFIYMDKVKSLGANVYESYSCL